MIDIQELEKYPFKQRLIMLRTIRGLSQQELSADINANASSIGAWERGESLPKGDKLEQLAAALDVPHIVLIRWRIEETIKRKSKGKLS
jgi:transcriptional regulator with XRE-family HTH domain